MKQVVFGTVKHVMRVHLPQLETMPQEGEEEAEKWSFFMSRLFVTEDAHEHLAKMADLRPYSTEWLGELADVMKLTADKAKEGSGARVWKWRVSIRASQYHPVASHGSLPLPPALREAARSTRCATS
jgi:hypothetical protein